MLEGRKFDDGDAKALVADPRLPNAALDDVFAATVQSTEEAIVNAMVAARDMTGINGHFVPALPHDRLREILKAHARLGK